MMDEETKKAITEAYQNLPPVVRDAIDSSDVSNKLRALAENFKLHVDQWQLLEDEVLYTILGLQDPNDLAPEIVRNVEVPPEEALKLAEAINERIFIPIRQQIDRELGSPQAEAKEVTDVEQLRQDVLHEDRKTAATPAEVPTVGAPPAPAASSVPPGQ